MVRFPNYWRNPHPIAPGDPAARLFASKSVDLRRPVSNLGWRVLSELVGDQYCEPAGDGGEPVLRARAVTCKLREKATVTRAAKTIPKLPDGSSAGGSPYAAKVGPAAAEDTDAAPKKMESKKEPPKSRVDDSLKPIISGQVGANVNDRYGNSMRPN